MWASSLKLWEHYFKTLDVINAGRRPLACLLHIDHRVHAHLKNSSWDYKTWKGYTAKALQSKGHHSCNVFCLLITETSLTFLWESLLRPFLRCAFLLRVWLISLIYKSCSLSDGQYVIAYIYFVHGNLMQVVQCVIFDLENFSCLS